MRLKCLVCGHEFESAERYVVLQSWVKHAGGSGQGVQLAICAKHLSEEVTDALLLNTSAWSDHTHQVYAEQSLWRLSKAVSRD